MHLILLCIPLLLFIPQAFATASDGFYPFGGFILSVSQETSGSATNRARLRIHAAAEPGHALWETAPTQPFLTAEVGIAKVSTRFGSYGVSIKKSATCTTPIIEAITSSGNSLLVEGIFASCPKKRKLTFSVTFSERAAHTVAVAIATSDKTYNQLTLSLQSEPNEHYFGFGEQFTYADMKGRRLPILVQEQGIGRGAQPISRLIGLAGASGDWSTSYAPVPHYITNKRRSLALENSEYAVFDMKDPQTTQIEVSAPDIRALIFHGTTPLDLIEAYTSYAGRMPPLPDWFAGGATIAVQGGTAAVREKVARCEAAGVPLSAVWIQDWVGKRRTLAGSQLWWNWDLDREHYPDWEKMTTDLKQKGIRVLSYVNPFLIEVPKSKRVSRNLQKEAAEQGFLVENQQGDPLVIMLTFPTYILDLTNEAARSWMAGVFASQILSTGVSGWMSDYGEAFPFSAKPSSGESPWSYHNRYPEDWAAINRMTGAIVAAERGDEYLFFSRSGYTRAPRHARLFWLGDQLASWDEHDGIKTAVTGLISSGISGFSLNHSDIGGYNNFGIGRLSYRRTKELFLRWAELSAFTPAFRTHEGLNPAGNHQFDSDSETLAAFARLTKIYRALLPYRRALMDDASQLGHPLVRHPVLHYPDDPQTYGIRHQFMLGSEFYVAPVLDERKTSIRFYLPKGKWVHLWSHQPISGGQAVEIQAPLGYPAILYKRGSKVGEALRERLAAEKLL